MKNFCGKNETLVLFNFIVIAYPFIAGVFLIFSFLLSTFQVFRGNRNFWHVEDAIRFFVVRMGFLAWGESGATPY
jgi:hypothetical protein